MLTRETRRPIDFDEYIRGSRSFDESAVKTPERKDRVIVREYTSLPASLYFEVRLKRNTAKASSQWNVPLCVPIVKGSYNLAFFAAGCSEWSSEVRGLITVAATCAVGNRDTDIDLWELLVVNRGNWGDFRK